MFALSGVTSVAACQTFIAIEGLDTIAAFAMLIRINNVTKMGRGMASCSSVAAGRVILETMQINKKIPALAYTVKDHHK